MVDISRTYINETIRKYGVHQISEDARALFLEELRDYADLLAEKSNVAVRNRKGKKLMRKDIKLALEIM